MHIPGEVVTDPWLFPLALAVHAREVAKFRRGGSRDDDDDDYDVICTGREVDMGSSSFDEGTGLWSIATRKTPALAAIEGGGKSERESDDSDARTIRARCVINASGINSDLVQSSAASSCDGVPPPAYEARPRRGQYAVFSAPPPSTVPRCDEADGAEWPDVPRMLPARPIQPVPTQFTKGVFVYSTLYDQVVVGPTATDQHSRLDDSIDRGVARDLAAHASSVLGRDFRLGVDDGGEEVGSQLIGEYVGVRPGTSERDYQIRLHPRSSFITVGGIRSTGLTASLGIGRHVARCLLPAVVPRPSLLQDGGDGAQHPPRPTPLPDVKELAEQFRVRGDGTVLVAGRSYRVTHPLTRMGWEAGTGLASPPSR